MILPFTALFKKRDKIFIYIFLNNNRREAVILVKFITNHRYRARFCINYFEFLFSSSSFPVAGMLSRITTATTVMTVSGSIYIPL